MVAARQGPIARADLEALRKNVDQWVRFCLANDWDSLTSLMTEDVVFLPPDSPAIEGKKAVRAFLEEFPRIRAMTASIAQAEGSTGIAWARGPYTMSVDAPGSGQAKVDGKFTATYRIQPDGKWLVSSDTFNNDARSGSPLSGTWEIVGDDPVLGPANSIHMFTSTHYAVLRVATARKKFAKPQPTDLEAADAFHTMAAAAGTYTISGSTITFNQELSRTPSARP